MSFRVGLVPSLQRVRRLFSSAKVLSYSFLALVMFSLITVGCFQSNNQSVISAEQSYGNTNSSLGIGLSGIADWSTELPFLDSFKLSRKWLTQCVGEDPGCNSVGEWDTNEYSLLKLDKNGWIRSLPTPSDAPKFTRVSTLVHREIPGHYPSGKYLVLYKGEGTISYGFDAQKDEAASKPGRDVINVDATKGGGIYITISSTDPRKTGNYIRDIRVIKAENAAIYSKGEIFNPSFLDKIKDFRALRFMDWMQTNDSQQQEWSSRPTPTTASYAWKGAPVEVMVALANKVNADPWFNMPHMATDDYIKRFALLVKEKLNPKLKAYVEFSNEVWNWQFAQANYALQQGQARWGKDKGDAYMHWYGMRTARMCDAWKTAFADQKDRVVCVISTQTGWQGLESAALDCSYWVAEGHSACYKHGISAYAITGYFSGDLGNPDHSATVESWLSDADGGMKKATQQLKQGGLLQNAGDSLVDVYNSFVYHANVAKQRNLALVAYEGGQHVVGRAGAENNEKLANFFVELNRQPAFHELYTQLLSNWRKAGGTLFMHFVDVGLPSKWGSWGALEYVSQSTSPKYKALVDFNKNNRCWWSKCERNV